jgi:hypothetical protein
VAIHLNAEESLIGVKVSNQVSYLTPDGKNAKEMLEKA